MSKSGTSGNKTTQNVSERVQKTKLEILALKEELGKLVESGITTRVTAAKEENKENNSIPYFQPPKSASALPKSPRNVQQQAPDELVSKTKKYNVKDAQAYIKKQKEQRSNALKLKTVPKCTEIELKKEKLRELDRRTRDLVARNVQISRERSKSRGRTDQIRIDASRSHSQTRFLSTGTEKRQILAKDSARSRSETRQHPNKSENVRDLPKAREIKSKETSEGITSKTVKNIPKRKEGNVPPCFYGEKSDQIISPIRSAIIPVINVIQAPTIDETQKFADDSEQLLPVNDNKAPIVKQTTKETQTAEKHVNEVPDWLRSTPDHQNPYNFINSVKRKLQFAVNSPKLGIDKGVQSEKPHQEPQSVKTRSEIKELLINSTKSDRKYESKIKLSSKPVLDLKNVEKLGLKANKRTETETFSKSVYVSESDSDTSKNIPEISSETAISPKTSEGSRIVSKVYESRMFASQKLKSDPVVIKSPVFDEKSENLGTKPTNTYTSDFMDEVSTKNSANNSEIRTEIDAKVTKRRSSGQQMSFHSLLSQDEVETQKNNGADANLPLKEPSISLKMQSETRSITFRDKAGEILTKNTKETHLNIIKGGKAVHEQNLDENNVNRIHLKFEAEVQLLSDFNQSLRQFSNLERAYENLKKHQHDGPILQNANTQTSIIRDSLEKKAPSTINCSRGSSTFNDTNNTISSIWDLSSLYVGKDSTIMGNFENRENKSDNLQCSNMENLKFNHCVGVSLNMFDQLIKDEDVRIAHLKTIIKIREQSLLDRARGELLFLELQRKQLIETGKVGEAKFIKKRQRGILLKTEEERNEINKLKQIQKQASDERKTILQRQKQSLIKAQLATHPMSTKVRVNERKERRNSGPLKVLQQSFSSDASISCKSVTDDASLRSIQSTYSIRTKNLESETPKKGGEWFMNKELPSVQIPVAKIERSLLLREVALEKRRQTAEGLLKWHQKLLDEEKKIAELEQAAKTAIKQAPKSPPPAPPAKTLKFSGSELNHLWSTLSKSTTPRFPSAKSYEMSQVAYRRFCKAALKYCDENADNGSEIDTYTTLFDAESPELSETNAQSQVISELIDNFNKIEDNISALGKNTDLELSHFDKTFLVGNNGAAMTVLGDKEAVIAEKIGELSTLRNEGASTEELGTEISKDDSIKTSVEAKSEEVEFDLSENSETSSKISEIAFNRSKSSLKSSDGLFEKSKTNLKSLKSGENSSKTSLLFDISTKEAVTDSESIGTEDNIKTSEIIDESFEKVDIYSISTKDLQSSDLKENSIEDVETKLEATKIKEISIKPIEIDVGSIKLITDSKLGNVECNNSHNIVEKRLKIDTKAKSSQIDENSLESIKTVDESDEKLESESILSKISETESKISEITENSLMKIKTDSKASKPDENELKSIEAINLSFEKLENESILNKCSDTESNLSEINENSIIKTKTDSNASKTDANDLKSIEAVEISFEKLEPESILRKISETALKTTKITEKSESIHEADSKSSKTDENSLKSIKTLDESFEKLQTESTLSKTSENSLKTAEESATDPNSIKTSESEKSIKESIELQAVDRFSNTIELDEALESASKIEDSLRKLNEKLAPNENSILESSKIDLSDESNVSTSSKLNDSGEATSKKNSVDVKKRVSEILDASSYKSGDKSPRMQDLYVTTYDLGGNAPENVENEEKTNKAPNSVILGSEAEELFKKQLAIEQEIKQLEQQTLSYALMREIPNKPPPPYTPPSFLPASNVLESVLPTDVREINEITNYCSKVMYKAYQNASFDKIRFSETSFKLCSQIELNKQCGELLFNVCRDLARAHYKQFEINENCPSWLVVKRREKLAVKKPFDCIGLERFLNRKLKELFGFVRVQTNESANIKWGRKKRDHVDEILVKESQEEESQWISFDQDELLVKDQVVNDLMNTLLDDTIAVFSRVLAKKNSKVFSNNVR